MPIFLCVKRGPPELLNKRVMIPKAVSTVGSAAAADLPFPGVTGLAPLHAKVYLDGRDLMVEGLSLNPVIARGQKGVIQRIKLNETVAFGDHIECAYEHTPSSQMGSIPMPALRPAGFSTPVSSDMLAKVEERIASIAGEDHSEASVASVVLGRPKASPLAEKPAQGAPAARPAPKKEPAQARAIAEVQLPYGEPLALEDFQGFPIFKGMAAAQLSKLPGSVVLRSFKKGELICREGEYGFTAFYIVAGMCDVYIGAPIAHVTSSKEESARRGLFGILRDFKHRLLRRKEPSKDPSASSIQRFIPIDGPEDLPLDNPIGKLRAGDLFGEMSCTSLYPRSATVRATTDCIMLEMLSNVLFAVKDNPSYKKRYNAEYRERALSQHLRRVNILSGLDDTFINQLKERVELMAYKKGEVIVKQGDPADAFYLIRFGNVKVSKSLPGGDIVLNYLGRTDFFGEVGLLHGGVRMATCTALDRVECVRIQKADFDFMLSWYDDVREKMEAIATERERATTERAAGMPTVPMDDFMSQGLMQAQSLLLLDLNSCTRCDECVHACADSHEGVTRLVREGLRFDKYLVATSCRSCMDPVCMPGCPVGSIHRQESMEIMIEDWCIGCGLCAKNCPYGNITMHAFPGDPVDEKAASEGRAEPPAAAVKKAAPKEKQKAVTCDLCHDLDEPSCVYACPHDAAHRVDARKFFATGGDLKKSKI